PQASDQVVLIGKLMVNDFQKILMETKQLLQDGGFLPFNYPGSGLAIQQLLGFHLLGKVMSRDVV
ncbi:hypothetical protein J7L84_00370, partial [Candidatus Bipolaricaulota bacterium]|nr:hypothetical protein [Candidatus Bipolaricaulota bacterium]